MSDLVSQNLNMIFKTPKGETVHALKDLNFTIKKGELLTVLGPSGCGKTTLLNIAAGFIRPTSGTITLGNNEINGPGVDRGMVFQQGALFEWLTVAENVNFGLRMKKKNPEEELSEPIKPILDTVIMSNAVHMYISQSDKGEMVLGAGVDKYNSYAQKGSFPVPQHMISAAVELFPVLSRLRMLRHWGGIVDTCPDASPIISKTDVDGLYFNCGWGTGGFKADDIKEIFRKQNEDLFDEFQTDPKNKSFSFADLIANNEPNKISAPYSINRFNTGFLIDEHGAAGVAH